MISKASDLRNELIKRFGYAPWLGDGGGAGASVYMDTIVGQSIREAMLSVTKDDICDITGKHVECASPSERYCPCNTCQAYLRRITESVK